MHDPLAPHLAQLSLSFGSLQEGHGPHWYLSQYLRSIGYRLPRGDVEELVFRWVVQFDWGPAAASTKAYHAMQRHSRTWSDLHGVRRAGP